MAGEPFERVLRGFEPRAVLERIEALESERTYLKTQLAESQESITELRLSMVKQVEEASAEAAIVLGHGRSEAARIREKAIAESDSILADAKAAARELDKEAKATRAEAETLRTDAKEAAADIRSQAEDDAHSILDSARARATALEAEAAEKLESAIARSDQISQELRLQKQELDRSEGEIRDQADSYALRVHREADAYAAAAERRVLDLESQAEEILAEAKRSAHDITARATSTARKNLEESLRLVNLIFSDVSGSLQEVTRIRALLGDQVERLSIRESAPHEITDVVDSPSVPSDAPSSRESEESEDSDED